MQCHLLVHLFKQGVPVEAPCGLKGYNKEQYGKEYKKGKREAHAATLTEHTRMCLMLVMHTSITGFVMS